MHLASDWLGDIIVTCCSSRPSSDNPPPAVWVERDNAQGIKWIMLKFGLHAGSTGSHVI